MEDIFNKVVEDYSTSPWNCLEKSGHCLGNMLSETQFELGKLVRYSQMWGNAKMTQKRMDTIAGRLSAVIHHVLLSYYLVGGEIDALGEEEIAVVAETFHSDYKIIPMLCANMSIGFMTDWIEAVYTMEGDPPDLPPIPGTPSLADEADAAMDDMAGIPAGEGGMLFEADNEGETRDPSIFGVEADSTDPIFPLTILAATMTIANAFELDYGVILDNASIINLKDISLNAAKV